MSASGDEEPGKIWAAAYLMLLTSPGAERQVEDWSHIFCAELVESGRGPLAPTCFFTVRTKIILERHLAGKYRAPNQSRAQQGDESMTPIRNRCQPCGCIQAQIGATCKKMMETHRIHIANHKAA